MKVLYAKHWALFGVIFLFSVFCFAKPALAATANYIGASGGNWNTASNWDTAAVPDSSTDVVIASSTNVTVTASGSNINFNSLTIGGGSATTQNLILTGNIGTGGSITIANKGTLTQNNAVAQTISGTLLIQSGGLLTHSANGTTAQGQMYIVNFSAATVTVNSGGSINVDNLGYAAPPNNTNGYGPGGGVLPGNGYTGGGGANGGNGGIDINGGRGGYGYCNLSDPASSGIGSSGAHGNGGTGNAGGGLIVLNVSGTLTINGTISAKGQGTGTASGGAGGSIKIIADTIAGTPQTFSISGGSSSGGSAGGGGGCALLSYTTSNTISPTSSYFTMNGSGASTYIGGAGQVLVKQSSANGNLYSINSSSGTSTPLMYNYTVDTFIVSSSAMVDIPAGKTLTVSSAQQTILGDSTGTGKIRDYGTLTFSSGTLSSFNNFTLYLYSGGSLTNSNTIAVPSTGGLYLYQGALLSNNNLTSLNSTGTLYLAAGTVGSITSFWSAGTTNIYNGFATSTVGTLTINGGTVTMNNYTTSTSALSLTGLTINSGGTLTHAANGTTAQGQMHTVNINASTITINSGGSINADNQGYAAPSSNYTNGYGPGGGTQPGNGWAGGGGANGGNAGVDTNGGRGGYGYCNLSDPASSGIGSSGARGNGGTANAGGGLIVLNVSGTLTVNGTISAKGQGTGNLSGGAGGSIKIIADTIAGTPQTFSISGGGSTGGNGSGGGGCAYVQYTTSNTISPTSSYFSMYGGTGSYPGGAGQVLVKQSSANGNLYSINSSSGTSTPLMYNYTVDTFIVSSSAMVDIPAGKTLTVSSAQQTILGDSTGTGKIRDYGTLTFSSGTLSSFNNFTLYLYSGGSLTNSSTISVPSTGAFYVYQGATLSNTNLVNLSSTGTLYLGTGLLSNITTLNLAGPTSLYQNFVSGSVTNFNINSNVTTLYNFTTSSAALSVGTLIINSGATLTHAVNGTTAQGQMHTVNISAGNITINSGGSINVDNKGYGAQTNNNSNGYGPGAGLSPGNSWPGGGGANGGNGGAGSHGGAGGTAYCNLNDPAISGIGSSGGSGNGSYGNAGGGMIILNAAGTLTANGTISAKSTTVGSGGGGAGGAIKIVAGTIAGTPQAFSAAGGSSASFDGGGGGGGCVNITYTGTNSITSGQITVSGGSSGGGGSGSAGQKQLTQQILNLIGWWTFDGTDVSTSTVNDKSGQANNGTRFGGITMVPGKIGQAANFDGANYYIRTSYNNFPNAAADRSVSFWVRSTNMAQADAALMGWGSNSANAASVLVLGQGGTANRKISFYGNGNNLTSNGTLADNVWSYVTFVLSGTSAKIYINGALDNSGTLSGLNTTAASYFYMGAFSGLNNFKGNLDEVRIYSRALTPQEVLLLYSLYNSKMDSSGTSRGGTLASSGLVGYWTFDGADTTATTVKDKSGQGNDGNRTGNIKSTVGKIGQAMKFTGSNGISLGSFSNGTVMTRSAWIKTTYTTGQSSIIDNYAAGAGVWFGIQGATGKLMLWESLATPAGVTSNAIVTDGKWHFVAFTNDGTYTRFYIDGALDSRTAQALLTATDTGSIGISAGNFYGIIDDVRIYNRALSASEVQQLYKKGGGKIGSSKTTAPKTGINSGLVGWWTMDGPDTTATNALDKSGNGYNATRSNVTPATGKIGQAMGFLGDLSGSAIYIPVNSNTDLSNTTTTISEWVYVNSFVPGSNSLVELYCGSGPGNYSCIYSWGLGGVTVDMNADPYTYTVSFNPTLSLKKWYHLVVIIDRNINKATVYVNGVYKGQTAAWPAHVSTITAITAGYNSRTGNTHDYLNGRIDDLRLYNRALSTKEIQTLYASGKGITKK